VKRKEWSSGALARIMHVGKVCFYFCLCFFALSSAWQESKAASANDPAVVDSVRFYPAKDHEQDMMGAVFSGSNISPTAGLVRLGQIETVPAPNEWTTLLFNNKTPYRYLRYDAPKGWRCRVAELEFYAGKKMLKGQPFGSVLEGEAPGASLKAFDGNIKSIVDCSATDGQYIGTDLRDLSTTGSPTMSPAGGNFEEAQTVSLSSRTAGAAIIYTTDGTLPNAHFRNGVYRAPITIKNDAVLQALALSPDLTVSPVTSAVYLIGKPLITMHTLHVGNSLTASTHDLALYARTLGYVDDYRSFLHGGATTKVLWEDATGPKKDEWEKDLQSFSELSHFTLQPRDFDLNQEADYDVRFLNVIRSKWPSVQPWLYAEWVEFDRHRPTDRGTEKSSQMAKVWPAQTWEESMGAMILYVEDLQKEIAARSGALPSPQRAPNIIPSALAMGWMHHLIDEGKVPGMKPGSFHENLFQDGVHPNAAGQYLVDLTWLCAFTGQPATGATPVNTNLTNRQAVLMQKLAWDVVQNYAGAGWCHDGDRWMEPPRIKRLKQTANGTTYNITSKWPGAWFRYTLDGSEPTRTHGYVYCGIVTVPADAKLKVVAYQSGMTDSNVVAP
jgi:Chitobiase/beta-hexosaminidase C-terminal domain